VHPAQHLPQSGPRAVVYRRIAAAASTAEIGKLRTGRRVYACDAVLERTAQDLARAVEFM
jgi:hypothetical protein